MHFGSQLSLGMFSASGRGFDSFSYLHPFFPYGHDCLRYQSMLKIVLCHVLSKRVLFFNGCNLTKTTASVPSFYLCNSYLVCRGNLSYFTFVYRIKERRSIFPPFGCRRRNFDGSQTHFGNWVLNPSVMGQ